MRRGSGWPESAWAAATPSGRRPQDPRVRAVAGIAGGYNSPAEMAASMGIGGYRAALGALLDRYDSYLPAVAPDGGEAAMGGDEPYGYYGTSRSRSPHWRQRGHPGIAARADDV